ncbi:MAG: hypothetical protein WC372_11415 [Candidatus Neomarinimicrobiota bacterium]|jgi:hypothetical protein
MGKNKEKEIMDLLDMYADLYWTDKERGGPLKEAILFEGIDANHHSLEYDTMQRLLTKNKEQANGKGWSSEHHLYLEEGILKNSHSPFSYPTLLKRYAKYRELKPEGWLHTGVCLTTEQIQSILEVELSPEECRVVEQKYLM